MTTGHPGARRRGSRARPGDSGRRPQGVQEGQRLLPHHADSRDHGAKIEGQQTNLPLHAPGSSRVLTHILIKKKILEILQGDTSPREPWLG